MGNIMNVFYSKSSQKSGFHDLQLQTILFAFNLAQLRFWCLKTEHGFSSTLFTSLCLTSLHIFPKFLLCPLTSTQTKPPNTNTLLCQVTRFYSQLYRIQIHPYHKYQIEKMPSLRGLIPKGIEHGNVFCYKQILQELGKVTCNCSPCYLGG